jgi:hypothetical protein
VVRIRAQVSKVSNCPRCGRRFPYSWTAGAGRPGPDGRGWTAAKTVRNRSGITGRRLSFGLRPGFPPIAPRGFASPLSANGTEGFASPLSANGTEGFASPLSTNGTEGFASPFFANCSAGFLSTVPPLSSRLRRARVRRADLRRCDGAAQRGARPRRCFLPTARWFTSGCALALLPTAARSVGRPPLMRWRRRDAAV